jgi:hypothetical protein
MPSDQKTTTPRAPWRYRVIDDPSDRPPCPNVRCHISSVQVVWLPNHFRCANCGTTFEATR